MSPVCACGAAPMEGYVVCFGCVDELPVADKYRVPRGGVWPRLERLPSGNVLATMPSGEAFEYGKVTP